MFIFILFLRERERERERGRERGRHRIQSRVQALSCQHRAESGAQTHRPQDHDLSHSQTLNQLSHPGAPEIGFEYIPTFILLFTLFLLCRFLPLSTNKCLLKFPDPIALLKDSLNPFFREVLSEFTNLILSTLWKPHSILSLLF